MSVNPLNPQSNQHLISSHSNKTESFIKIIGIKEMIAIPRGFDFKRFSLSVVDYQLKAGYGRKTKPLV